MSSKSLDLVEFPANTTDFPEMWLYRMMEVRRVLNDVVVRSLELALDVMIARFSLSHILASLSL